MSDDQFSFFWGMGVMTGGSARSLKMLLGAQCITKIEISRMTKVVIVKELGHKLHTQAKHVHLSSSHGVFLFPLLQVTRAILCGTWAGMNESLGLCG